MEVSEQMKRAFYGRQWVFERIRDTLKKGKDKEPKYRGAIILGQPGSGKTSICLQLVNPSNSQGIEKELSQRVIAYHLCQAQNQPSLDVFQFIRNLALQLCKQESLANYSKVYQTPAIQDLLKKDHENKDMVNVFKKVILDSLKSCHVADEKYLVVVDSVDEAVVDESRRSTDVITICDLLVIALQQDLFPPWLCLLITIRRQSKEVVKMFSGLRKITLDDLKKSYVVKDVQQYILDRLDSDADLRKHLTRYTAEKFNLLHVKSNGCILYLEKILDNVINGVLSMEDVSEIPGTLNGLYLWLCQRLFGEDLYNNNFRPILEILLAANKLLSFAELLNVVKLMNSSIDEKELQANLATMSAVVLQEDGICQISHHSFSEWLIDVKHCTRKFLCSIAKGHAMLAVYFMCGGKTLSFQENERFLCHLLQSQYPSSDPSKLDQWLKWTGVKSEDAETFNHIKGQEKMVTFCEKNGVVPAEPVKESYSTKENNGQSPMKKPTSVLDAHKDKDLTPLLKASCSGNSGDVRSLLQNGADVNFVDRSGRTALSLACGKGHMNIVHDLINCGAEINTRDCDGCTPLRAAARSGSADVVTLLLKHGAIPDLADNDKRTALRAAAWGGHTNIVLQLLQKGADANLMDREGRTALIAAAHTACAEVVEVLLDHKANLNHIDGDGRTALAVCVLSDSSKNQLDVIKILLESGADVNHPDFDGMTPLCLACMLGQNDIVLHLLQAKADVNHWDRHGRTPLMLASANGHHNVVKLLLEYIREHCKELPKETISRKDNSGWTPMLVAAHNGFGNVLQLLLFYGGSLKESDDSSRTALMLAAHEGHVSLVEQLLSAGALVNLKSLEGCTAVHYAALFGHIDCVDTLLEKGADVNILDNYRNTPLNLAAKEGNSKMCEVLLKGGAKVNSQDPSGRTPLHTAAWKGFYNVTETLIEYGADVNHADIMGYTPLMTASWQGHTSVLNLLLKKNAMVDVSSNNDKASALSIAAQEGHEDVVRMLLDNKASNLPDKYGRDPIKVAQQAGNRGVVHILEAYNALQSYDGNFTNTLKKQFPKLTKGTSIDNTSPSSTPSPARINKKSMERSMSTTSSREKFGSEDLANSNTSISSNDPSTPYFDEDEYCPSYCGPCGEMSAKMSTSCSSFKQSKSTVLTGSTLDDEVFFGRSISKDFVNKIPFEFNSGYHGCDPFSLRKALEMPSIETTL